MASMRIKAFTRSGAIDLGHKVPPPKARSHVEQIAKPAHSIEKCYALTISLRRFWLDQMGGQWRGGGTFPVQVIGANHLSLQTTYKTRGAVPLHQ
jgi:hypothetical protein